MKIGVRKKAPQIKGQANALLKMFDFDPKKCSKLLNIKDILEILP